MGIGIGIGEDAFWNKKSGSIYDSDAQAYIDAVGGLDVTNKDAVNQLVLDLKAASVWTKLLLINCKCGSTAAEHKWNLKDPRDLDAAYRYTYSGTWVHSANGAACNTTNTYANTYLNPNTLGIGTDITLGYYLNVAPTIYADKHLMGTFSSSNNFMSIQHQTPTVIYGVAFTGSAVTNLTIDSAHNGFFAMSINGTDKKIYNKALVSSTYTTNGTAAADLNLWEGALNLNNTRYSGSADGRLGCSFVGNGMNDTEIADLRSAIVTFETSLGRNI